MSACPASDSALQELIPVLRKYANSTRLRLEFIGMGDVQTGLKSLNGPAEVVGDYYLLCSQNDFWSGVGSQEDYLAHLSFVDCLSGRSDPRRLPLESCAYLADSSSKIHQCLDDAPYLLEKSFKRSAQSGIERSPTLFLQWPRRSSNHAAQSPVPFCSQPSSQSLEVALCAALIDEAATLEMFSLHKQAREDNAQVLSEALINSWKETVGPTLQNISQNCDNSGASKISSTCRGGGMDGAMLVVFYLLPGVLIMFVLCFGVSSFSRIFRLGLNQQQQPGARVFERFSFQLPVLGADVIPSPSGVGANLGLDPLLINSMPTSSASALGIASAEGSDGEGCLHCSICVDEIDATADVFALKCRHVFHKDCLRSWLEKKNECPVCRQPAWRDNAPCETAL